MRSLAILALSFCFHCCRQRSFYSLPRTIWRKSARGDEGQGAVTDRLFIAHDGGSNGRRAVGGSRFDPESRSPTYLASNSNCYNRRHYFLSAFCILLSAFEYAST